MPPRVPAALAVTVLPACIPQIAISPGAEVSVWLRRKGWDALPFVAFAPGAYAMMREDGYVSATVSIASGDASTCMDYLAERTMEHP